VRDFLKKYEFTFCSFFWFVLLCACRFLKEKSLENIVFSRLSVVRGQDLRT
jgi:hypothetical protein